MEVVSVPQPSQPIQRQQPEILKTSLRAFHNGFFIIVPNCCLNAQGSTLPSCFFQSQSLVFTGLLEAIPLIMPVPR